MATKNDLLNKQNSCLVNDSQKYSNFIINQSQKHSVDVTPVQSKFNKSNDIKIFDSVKSEIYQTKQISQPWTKKSLKSLKFDESLNFCNKAVEKEDSKKEWHNLSNSTTIKNASTLSLHIAAYENSIEAGDTVPLSSSIDERDKGLKDKFDLNLAYSKQEFVGSNMIFQNPFEFPRQQKEEEISFDPEVMQFKASQKLLNPNESIGLNYNNFDKKENEIIFPKSGAQGMPQFISQNPTEHSLTEFHEKASKILDMISPHFITMIYFEDVFQNFYKISIESILADYCSSLAIKEEYIRSIPNIKIKKFIRGIFISSTAKAGKNGEERILTVSEAMDFLKEVEEKKSKNSIAELKKKFYGKK